MNRRTIGAALAVAAALALPSAASAATISFSGDVLTYSGGAEENNVTFALSTDDYSCSATGVTPCRLFTR